MLLLLISLLTVSISAWVQSKMLDVPVRVDQVITFFILACANIVFSTIVLSELHRISPAGYLFLQSVIAAVSGGIYVTFRSRFMRTLNETPGKSLIVDYGPHFPKVIMVGLFLAIAAVALINLFLAIYVPPNNYDSMTYHLSRVGYWNQIGSLRQYQTDNFQQTQYPPNAEILILWTVVFLKSDFLANLVQWLSYIGVGFVVYGVSNTLGYGHRSSLFSALIYLSLPMVVLQSSTTQNDLVVTFFTISAFYFLHGGFKEGNKGKLVLSALAAGLALGTKGTFFFIIPGFVVGSLIVVFISRVRPSLYLQWLTFCLVGVLLLGSYIYIQNYQNVGHPLGSEWALVKQYNDRNEKSSGPLNGIERVFKNLISVSYKSIEFTGLPSPWATHLYEIKESIGEQYLARSIFKNNYDAMGGGSPPIGHEDSEWFGFLGFFLYVPLSIGSLSKAILRRQLDASWVYFLVGISFFICFFYFYSVPSPYSVRYFVLPMAFVAPLLGSIQEISAKWFKMIVVLIISLIAIDASMHLSLRNCLKPLNGERSVLQSDYFYKRAILWNTFQIRPFMRFIEEFTRSGDRIGSVMKYWRWDYPLFGRDFSRVVIPIRSSEYDGKNEEVMKRYNLDFLIVEIDASEAINCFDPVFRGEGDVMYRVVSGHPWDVEIERRVLSEKDHSHNKVVTAITVFSATANLSTPLRLLFEYAQQLGAEKDIVLADTRKMAYFTTNMDSINAPYLFSPSTPLSRAVIDGKCYSILSQINDSASLELQGKIEGESGIVGLVSDRGEFNRSIPTTRDGRFNYTIPRANKPSHGSTWHLLQVEIPDGEKKSSISKLSVFDPAAPLLLDLLTDDMRLDGFYGLEGGKELSWRWTTGNASISFPLRDPDRPHLLTITCEQPPGNPGNLRITFNGKPLVPISFGSTRVDTFHFVIPAGWISVDGNQSLKFSAEPFCPAKEGSSSDTRSLGVRIFQVTIANKR